MHFDSLDYILFLTLSVAAYWAARAHPLWRLGSLFIASCAFYMAWHPLYIVLILGSTVLDFSMGLRIARARSQRAKKAYLLASVVGNLGLLGMFKYFNFAARVAVDGLELLGYSLRAPYLDVLLPVGISFYTFQTLSYTIDVYRGRLNATSNPIEFAVFVTYFPQLVAGPIVRAAEMLPQLRQFPKLTRRQSSEGLFLIATGLIKKVAIADYLSINLVDRIFDNPAGYTAVEVVVGLYGFTMQMYCDFSGYTDVARGSAKLMGLELPDNFDRPYQATNPADFWRRWHQTLSSWLRDYLYVPLGGSRCGPVRAYFSLALTMFLIGIWHGASWTFVYYALLQATAMVLHRFVRRRSRRSRNDAVHPAAVNVTMIAAKIFANLQFVVFSRILFRATDLQNAVDVTERLWSGQTSTAQITPAVWFVLLLSFALHYTPKRWFERLEREFVWQSPAFQALGLVVVGCILSLVASAQVVPYIYFQF
ncbi:MAG: MBOAT family O-acyltransferase [Myxococcota bacterium]